MVTLPTGLTVPQASDAYQPDADIRTLADSLAGKVIVPVANEAERAALVASLTWTPSPSRPLYVHRADAGTGLELEVTTSGTVWRTVRAWAPQGLVIGGQANIPSAAWTRIPGYSTEPLGKGVGDMTYANGGFQVPVDGVYRASGGASFPGGGTGRRGVRYGIDGAIVEPEMLFPAGTGTTVAYPAPTYPFLLTAGQIVSLWVYQESGENQIITRAWLSLTREN